MSFTEITPYDGQLPSSSDPASFDGRASALMSWLVANFAPEIQALAVEIATALNGEEDTLAAVQALSDSLKSAAHYNANDNEDFTVDPNALPTRAAVAGYVEGYAKATITSPIPTTSGNKIDYTSIPSGATEIILIFNGVSFSEGVSRIIQLGSGSVQSSGYFSNSTRQASSGSNSDSSSGFVVEVSGTSPLYGEITLQKGAGNLWSMSGSMKAGNNTVLSAGIVALSGEIDRIRLTSTSATDVFNGGEISISCRF
jgi:hypothetical protein